MGKGLDSPRDSADDAAAQSCDHPGCDEEGPYRAPRSPLDLTSYYWFCMAHVRQYNAQWNYYTGMSEREVESDVRLDTVWRRPTWPMGAGAYSLNGIHDPMGLFGGETQATPRPVAGTPEGDAMIVLDLEPPVTEAAVKARYKELVKRHHPDANGGDKASEEKIKRINEAYATIMESLCP